LQTRALRPYISTSRDRSEAIPGAARQLSDARPHARGAGALPGNPGLLLTTLTSLDYAPDGKGFFVGDNSLTEVRKLYINVARNSSVLWRQLRTLPMIWGIPSPDGKYLALMMFTEDSNVYVVENFWRNRPDKATLPCLQGAFKGVKS
jgi:hypothetical protein